MTKLKNKYSGIPQTSHISAPVLSRTLTLLLNVMCTQVILNIQNCHHKEDKLDKTTYRPVSILVVMSNI